MSKPAIKVLSDRSGSMHSLQRSATEAIAGFISERKAIGDNPWISLSEFDTKYDIVYPFTRINDVLAYTLVPRGGTALNDAIASAVKEIDEFRPGKPRDRYLVIMTDGMENASTEHTKASIKSLLEDRQAKGLKVIYLGANQDAIAVAAEYSIPESSSMEWSGGSGLKSAISGSSFLSSSPQAYSRGFTYDMRERSLSDDQD